MTWFLCCFQTNWIMLTRWSIRWRRCRNREKPTRTCELAAALLTSQLRWLRWLTFWLAALCRYRVKDKSDRATVEQVSFKMLLFRRLDRNGAAGYELWWIWWYWSPDDHLLNLISDKCSSKHTKIKLISWLINNEAQTPSQQDEDQSPTLHRQFLIFCAADWEVNNQPIRNICCWSQLNIVLLLQVLDPRTRMILFKMLSRGVICEINGCISTGKEVSSHSSIQSAITHQYTCLSSGGTC